MGHASIATTHIYLHHLGTGADRAGLDRLNAPRHVRGTQTEPGADLEKCETRPDEHLPNSERVSDRWS
jgi:hypothetical protein